MNFFVKWLCISEKMPEPVYIAAHIIGITFVHSNMPDSRIPIKNFPFLLYFLPKDIRVCELRFIPFYMAE